MANEGIAVQIIHNIAQTLTQVDGSGDYVNTISADQVFTVARHPEDLNVGLNPYFQIILGPEERSKNPSFLRSTFVVDILGTYKNMDEKEISSYHRDIERALAQDITRGVKQCFESWVKEIVPDNRSMGELRFSVMTVECKYTYKFGEP